MSELNVYIAYEADDFPDETEFYLKSEADKVIARNKYKRCMAMATVYHLQMILTCSNSESILFKQACRRSQKYLEFADKLKE